MTIFCRYKGRTVVPETPDSKIPGSSLYSIPEEVLPLKKTDKKNTQDSQLSDVLEESFEVLEGFDDVCPLEKGSEEGTATCQKSEGSHVAKVVQEGGEQVSPAVTTFELVEPPDAQASGKNL